MNRLIPGDQRVQPQMYSSRFLLMRVIRHADDTDPGYSHAMRFHDWAGKMIIVMVLIGALALYLLLASKGLVRFTDTP